MRLDEMSADEVRAMPIGAPLVAVSAPLTTAFVNGQILMFEGLDEEDATCIYVRNLSDVRSGGWSTYRFEPYKLDRTLIVEAPVEEENMAIQRFALDHGWKWPFGDTTTEYNTQALIFEPSLKEIMYSPTEETRRTALVLRAPDHLVAIKILLSGGTGNKPTSIEQILPYDVLEILRNAPTNPQLRGLIRAATNQAVPKETMAEGMVAIEKWLLENCDITTALPPPPPPPEVIDTIRVPYTIDEMVAGYTEWTRTDTVSGTAFVPREVVARGEDEVEDWIKDNYRNERHTTEVDADYGEEDNGNTQVNERRVTEIDIEMPDDEEEDNE